MKQPFVLDASLALAWCFQDEATQTTEEFLRDMGQTAAIVPAWWYIELVNVIAIAERKGRITPTKIKEYITLIDSLDIETDMEAPTLAFTHILPLCRAYKLTSYDAIYLELALRRRLPLATLDVPLRKAAKEVGIKLAL